MAKQIQATATVNVIWTKDFSQMYGYVVRALEESPEFKRNGLSFERLALKFYAPFSRFYTIEKGKTPSPKHAEPFSLKISVIFDQNNPEEWDVKITRVQSQTVLREIGTRGNESKNFISPRARSTNERLASPLTENGPSFSRSGLGQIPPYEGSLTTELSSLSMLREEWIRETVLADRANAEGLTIIQKFENFVATESSKHLLSPQNKRTYQTQLITYSESARMIDSIIHKINFRADKSFFEVKIKIGRTYGGHFTKVESSVMGIARNPPKSNQSSLTTGVDPDAEVLSDVEDIQAERSRYARDIVQGVQKIALPAAAILNAFNPLDPTNLLLSIGTAGGATVVATTVKAARAAAKAIKTRRKLIVIVAKWGTEKATIINNALKAARENSQLRRAMGGAVKEGEQAHHLIPVQVLREHEVAQSAVVAGFDFNGKANGLALKTEFHLAGHTEYNELIMQELDDFARMNPNYTGADAKKYIEQTVVPHWRTNFSSAERVKLFFQEF